MEDYVKTFKVEDSINRLGKYLATPNFWLSLGLVAIAVIIWQVLKRARRKWKAKNPNSSNSSTLSNVLFDVGRFLFIVLVVVFLLQLNGVNVTAMITGLGVISAIVGLALQDLLKDIVMGVHILSDKFYKIGDVIRYENYEGEVISFNIRTTKIKLTQYNEIMTICNRNISEVQILSDMFDLDINLPYNQDPKKIHDIMQTFAVQIGNLEEVTSCLYKGTNSFNDSSVTYRLRYFTSPKGTRFDVRRAACRIVQDGLRSAGIPFAFNHVDVRMVEDIQEKAW